MLALDPPPTGSPIYRASQIIVESFVQFQVDDMACGGCAEKVTKAIRSVDPEAKVAVDLKLRRIAVETGADRSAVAAALAEVGYAPRPAG